MSPLRVGIVDYLNSRPLAWAFLDGRAPTDMEPVFAPPARVAEMLAAGEIDVGLIPSIELQRIAGLEVLPGLCVAAEYEVRSVLLISRKPPREIRRLALDQNSRTSAALVRIVLAERYGARPECFAAAPDVDRMLDEADAALLIGDPALHVERDRYLVFDLAREWHELTGFPFVFAVWAVREEVGSDPDLLPVFEDSLRAGLASIERMSVAAAEELSLELSIVNEYLTRNLSFTLGDAELGGLEEYFRRAHALGLTDSVRPLRFRAG